MQLSGSGPPPRLDAASCPVVADKGSATVVLHGGSAAGKALGDLWQAVVKGGTIRWNQLTSPSRARIVCRSRHTLLCLDQSTFLALPSVTLSSRGIDMGPVNLGVAHQDIR